MERFAFLAALHGWGGRRCAEWEGGDAAGNSSGARWLAAAPGLAARNEAERLFVVRPSPYSADRLSWF